MALTDRAAAETIQKHVRGRSARLRRTNRAAVGKWQHNARLRDEAPLIGASYVEERLATLRVISARLDLRVRRDAGQSSRNPPLVTGRAGEEVGWRVRGGTTRAELTDRSLIYTTLALRNKVAANIKWAQQHPSAAPPPRSPGAASPKRDDDHTSSSWDPPFWLPNSKRRLNFPRSQPVVKLAADGVTLVAPFRNLREPVAPTRPKTSMHELVPLLLARARSQPAVSYNLPSPTLIAGSGNAIRLEPCTSPSARLMLTPDPASGGVHLAIEVGRAVAIHPSDPVLSNRRLLERGRVHGSPEKKARPGTTTSPNMPQKLPRPTSASSCASSTTSIRAHSQLARSPPTATRTRAPLASSHELLPSRPSSAKAYFADPPARLAALPRPMSVAVQPRGLPISSASSPALTGHGAGASSRRMSSLEQALAATVANSGSAKISRAASTYLHKRGRLRSGSSYS